MKLEKILSGIKFKSRNFKNLDVKGISINSNQIQKGYMFIALKGTERDGHEYIYQAIERGALVLVVEDGHFEEILFNDEVVTIVTEDTKSILPRIAANFYNRPSRFLDIVGVTGTNGKTTITFILESIFKYSGLSPGVIGTISYRIGNREIPAINTTPDALSLQKYMQEMVESSQDLLLIEASSHGLKQGRLQGINFDYAVYTNLGSDHLDYHSDMEDYYHSKRILFTELLKKNGIAVINIDDSYGQRLWKEINKDKVSFGFDSSADVQVLSYKISLKGMYLKIRAFGEELESYTPLLGRHNIYNILAAVATAWKFGIEKEKIILALEKFPGIKGRLERVFGSSQVKVFIDYAHTPEALRAVLSTLRELKKEGNLWVVFGCGGDRYREKRPLMGKIAAGLADKVVVTSDNPRSETPLDIINEIMSGIGSCDKCSIIPDRKTAIEKTIACAQANDIVLIAGKGHERYQIIGNLVIPFDDREIASIVLTKRMIEEMANVF